MGTPEGCWEVHPPNSHTLKSGESVTWWLLSIGSECENCPCDGLSHGTGVGICPMGFMWGPRQRAQDPVESQLRVYCQCQGVGVGKGGVRGQEGIWGLSRVNSCPHPGPQG